MKTPAFTRIRRYVLSANQWFMGTSSRALDQAYEAALRIKKIEDEHFGGKKIPLEADYEDSVLAYFQTELKKNLRIARLRLIEFKASNSMFNKSKTDSSASGSLTKISSRETAVYPQLNTLDANQYTLEVEINNRPPFLEKLRFVDNILARYKAESANSIVVSRNADETQARVQTAPSDNNNQDSILKKSGFIPRSIFRTANKLKNDLDASIDSESEAVEQFRRSKNRTKKAIRFVLLLAIIPLLTQQFSKNLVFGPLVDHFSAIERIEISFNPEIEEKVITELQRFKEKIELERLIGQLPNISTEEVEEQVKNKAVELTEKYRWISTDPVKNILADALSLGVFTILIATSRREIAVLKSFIDEVVYGLSDSAKAFIIILFTDVFVGFHSPHGWVVIVENTLRHFGLPENEEFVDIFIATFPVMLDTVFKYWIFRYLNQISPSAVATYRNMNE